MRPAVLSLLLPLLFLASRTGSAAARDGEAWAAWADLAPGGAWAPVPRAKGDARVSGSLPAGFADNSAWADLAVDYTRREEDGTPYLRWDIREIVGGRAQLQASIPALDRKYYLRLRLKARAAKTDSFLVGVRQRNAPYHWLWSQELSLGTSWKGDSFDFVLGPVSEPAGLWLYSSAMNAIDFAELRLDAVPFDSLDRAAGDGGPAEADNLLRHSRFPLGLPAGANLDRDTADGDILAVAPDPAQPGPSGAPSLRLARRPSASYVKLPRIIGEPFVVARFWEPHTLSLSMKGGAGQLRLVEDGKVVAAQEFPTAPDWTRVALTVAEFKPGLPYQYEVVPHDELWVDAVQFAPGKQADYLSAGRPEIDVAAIPASRVYLEGEPARVRYRVTGKAAGLVLHARVVDVYGESRDLDPIPLSLPAALSGELPFDLFPGHPFGAFRVEAWLADAAGKPVGGDGEMAMVRVRVPRHLHEDAPDSPFGVHVVPTPRHLEMAKRLGINWARLHGPGQNDVGWSSLELAPGKWVFHDDDIARYRAYHLSILGILETAPSWETNAQKYGPHSDYSDRFYEPNDLSRYRSYVETITSRYKDQIRVWDVWNEPWNPFFWPLTYDASVQGRSAYRHGPNAIADFVALCRAAREGAKSVDPGLRVLGFSVSGDVGHYTEEWTHPLLAAGGMTPPPDIIDFHQYLTAPTLFPGDAVETGLRPILEARGAAATPYWMTEGNPVAGLVGTAFYNRSLPVPQPRNDDDVAARLCRYVLSHLANGTGKVFLYTMHGHDYMTHGKSVDCVLVGADGYPDPAASAYAAMAYWIEDAAFVRRLDAAQGASLYLFAAPGRTVAAFAPRPGAAPAAPPPGEGIAWYDVYGNPLESGAKVPGGGLAYGVSARPSADVARSWAAP